MRRAALVVLACLPACGHGASHGGHSSTHVSIQSTSVSVGLTLSIDGVEVVPDGVEYRLEQVTVDGDRQQDTRTLAGHDVDVRDGVFRLGDREYGPVEAGSRVRVTPAGVWVDDQARGALPGRDG